MNTKFELRQTIRLKRNRLDSSSQAQAAQKVAAQLHKLPIFKQSKRIACYISTNGELDTIPIIETIWQSGKTCYLPVLNPDLQNSLLFARYCKDDALVKNCYSIPEPVVNDNVTISTQNLDLVFVPVVAFDLKRNRLGQGAGYYDRTFSFKLSNSLQPPVLIGVAYDWQKVPTIEVSWWDVPLQMVITDSGLYASQE